MQVRLRKLQDLNLINMGNGGCISGKIRDFNIHLHRFRRFQDLGLIIIDQSAFLFITVRVVQPDILIVNKILTCQGF